MTAFEYITVLISIILGMGITQIVTGIAEMVAQWNRIKLYWPHILWIAFVFFLHIQDWWETFQLQQFTVWKLSTFLFVILYPINLFILARLLFPFGQVELVDFKAYYFANYRKFFLWLIILSVLAIINNITINNLPWSDQLAPFAIMITLGGIAWRDIQQEWLHQAIVIVLWLSVLTILWLKEFTISG